MSDHVNMEERRVSSCSFVICIVVLSVGVESSRFADTTTFRSSLSTVPTDFASSEFPTIAESKVSKNYATHPSEGEDDFSREPDVEGAPPDHIVPYSEHENPEEPSTRSKYTNGNVHRGIVTPEVELDFVPTKLYAQVRKTHTVKRLPREDALKSATNEEEILAAPRLREVVTKSKTNTVYTEEGYEDAAYDHGGHVRDADFQEDYTKRIGDPEDHSELNYIEEGSEIKEGVKTEELKDHNDDIKNPTKLDHFWQNPSINPKQVTENEIAKLEEDLENEYEESEKNTETEVPENLKNPYESDEEENEPWSGAATDRRGENEVTEKKDKPEDASDEFLNNNASEQSAEDKIRESSVSKPKENEYVFTSENPSVDYGKVFWDYFKSVQNDHQPDKFTEAGDIEGTTKTYETSSPEVLTSFPSFSNVHTTLANFDPDFNFSPSTELSSFITSRMDYLPSAASLYESWKRRDHNEDSEESSEGDPESSDSYESKSEEETRQEAEDFEKNASALNLHNVEGSTTLISPKKLSYTVIIRPSEKSRTQSCPCDREAHGKPGERAPNVKSSLSEPQLVGPAAINDFSNANDFTAIEPPLPAVPLRQVTYSDFLPHSYNSLAHPGVTPEIETTLRQINNGERDRYELVKNSYVNHPQNLHPRYNRFRGHTKNPRHFYPLTKLVPPAAINRSKYSDFWNIESVGRPIKKYDTTSNFQPWPEIMRFYRTIERRIFPRQKRSIIDGNNLSSTSHAYKIRDDISDVSSVKQLRPKRNLLGESNRLVGADNNAASEKSIGTGRRLKRSSERLLHVAPRIVDEVIDGEIESRFKDHDDDDDTESRDAGEDNDENRENIDIEVPDFNFSEVTENNQSERIITKPNVRKPLPDIHKYPYYGNSKIPRFSALTYITNPRTVPRKTFGGTEFYDSRDRYRDCDEIKPDLDSALPPERKAEGEEKREEDAGGEQQRENRPRLHGLGDRLDCFRAKYFDENPLDNPLFLEEEVGQPRLPEELDLKKLNSRISDMSNVEEHQIARRVSRKPEMITRGNNRIGSRNNPSIHRSGQQINRINPENEAKAQQSRSKENKILPRRHRMRKPRLRTTTETPEILTTPYQHEVYEDVMGTIKNLAGLYETFGESTISASSVLPEESRALVTPRGKKVDFESIHITEKPRGFVVQGLLPPDPTKPPQFQRYRIIPYRTNKVSYRTRLRTDNSPGAGGAKLSYFRTVTVHKRSVEDEENPLDLLRAESKSALNNLTSRSKKMKIDGKPAASERIVYTIQDRIRHSKPRGNNARQKHKYGNLETSASEAVKSQEPRNHRIARKNVTFADNQHAPIARRKGSRDDSEELVTAATSATSQSPTPGRHDYLDEPNEMYKIQYSTTHGKQIEPNNLQRRNVKENSEHSDVDENLEGDVTKEQDRYRVREQSEDYHTKGPESNEPPSEKPEFYQLRKYLESDPPGYSEAFGEKSPDSVDEDPEISYKEAETRKEANDNTEEEQGEDEEGDQVEKPLESFVDEGSSSESSEDSDPSEQLKSHDESGDNEEVQESEEDEVLDEEEGGEEMHSPLVEDETASNVEDSEKEFERFASRPFSPFESYEDSKYMDIGPRLSKPYFYHPSFSTLNYRRKKYSKDRSNEERKESDEKNSKYTFPWDANGSDDEEADGEKSSEESLKIERYEYPWERRERLARERQRKAKERKEHERLYGFSDDEDDEVQDDEPEDASGTQLRAKRVYPWEHYKIPSKHSVRRKTSRSRITDNEEMSSEHRPRFSSRYNTTNHSLNNDNDPVATSMEKATKDGLIQLSEIRSGLRSNKIPETAVTSTRGPPAFTVPSRKVTRRKIRTSATSTAPSTKSSSETKRKRRIWPTTTSTTKKPIVRRRPPSGKVTGKSLDTGSQKDAMVINLSEGNIRRRRPPSARSTNSNTSTTVITFRPRYEKTAVNPQQVNVQHEESTVKSIDMKNTTPKEKTTEHRSRFSKEEIITKTSYAGLNNENNRSNNDKQGLGGSSGNGDSSDSHDGLLNESIRKVSIMTQETPEHIYRTEEIDKNGIKGKFVSITPNNGTNSSLDLDQTPEHRGLIDPEETREMLKGFANSEENSEEQDSGISFMGTDSHIVANLLMQAPPHMAQLTFNEEMEKSDDFSNLEGSGTIQDYENHDENDSRIFIQNKYVKDPNQRLYYYIED